MRDAGWDPTYARATAVERRLGTLLPGIHTIGALWAEKARAYGLEVLDPTADVRVLEFCLGVPNEQFVRGDQDRWLMRRALRGVVPDEIRLNRRRGSQGADVAVRLRADADAVTAALERITVSDLVRSSIDIGGLRDTWDAVRRSGSPAAVLEGTSFVRGLGIGLLLLRFEGG
jgi:asparagine synthase (glutamine-hydrolysing)